MSENDPMVTMLKEWMDVFMHRSMRNFIEYVRSSGLSMSQLGALFHIAAQGKSGVTGLGEHLGVTSGAASQMLERLVQQDLIKRTEDPDDRRVKQIVLTEKGARILEEGVRARQSWLGELTATIPPDEKEPIMAALNVLIARANDLQAKQNTEES